MVLFSTGFCLFFSGEFQPVTWRCGAPLPSGQLCPRQDRLRCPLHGPIVQRDEAGTPLTPVASSPVKQAPRSKNKRRVERKRLAGVYTEPTTSRSRLEKKIFQRSVVKRVASALNAYDAKRTGAKFADQFNYAMQQ
jgi:hypothetical protein